MKFITFYTDGFYESVYKQYLKPSAEYFGLDLRAYKEHNHGDWSLNTRHKAKVILRGLHEWGDVVWLDVDAEVRRLPILFDEIPDEVDLAVYYLDWYKHWRNVDGQAKRELVNSVMMLRNRPRVIKLLEDWVEGNYGTTIWEQKVFQRLLEQSSELNIFRLPDPYCAILNYDKEVPAYIQEPVIVQHQISRVVKDDKMVLLPGGQCEKR